MFTTSSLNLSVHKIDLNQALANLSYYTDNVPEPEMLTRPELNFRIPESVDSGLTQIEEQHPSIKVAKENIEVTRSEMKRDVKSSQMPTLNLKGSVGYRDDYTYTDYRDEYSLMLEMNYDLFKGNETKYIKMKRYGLLLEKYQLLEKTKKDTSLRFKLAWDLYRSINEKIDLHIKTYLLEKTTLETYHKEFRLGGLSDLMDISVAENDYIRSIKDLVRVQYDLILIKFRIIEAMGGIIYRQTLHNTGTPEGNYKDDIVNWQEIYFNLLEVEPVKTQQPVPEQKQKVSLKPNCYEITVTSLNIRQKPDINSKIIGRLSKGGDVVCSNKQLSGWLDTSQGWLFMDYLRAK